MIIFITLGKLQFLLEKLRNFASRLSIEFILTCIDDVIVTSDMIDPLHTFQYYTCIFNGNRVAVLTSSFRAVISSKSSRA